MPTEWRLQGVALRNFAGCDIQPLSLREFLEYALSLPLPEGHPRLLGHHNLNSLALLRSDALVASFYRSCDACYVDGVPVLWLLWLAGFRTAGARRFSLMDELPTLLSLAQERKWRVFYLGGTPRTIYRARQWASQRWPELAIEWHHGYFDDDKRILAQINALQPDLLLVGMGMPQQEQWILRYRRGLRAGAILQAGGTIDYYTGEQAKPPRWLSRVGLGGLFRLLNNPGRLWQRYLLGPWCLLPALLKLRLAAK